PRGVPPPTVRVDCLSRQATVGLEEWSPIARTSRKGKGRVDRTRLTDPLAFSRDAAHRFGGGSVRRGWHVRLAVRSGRIIVGRDLALIANGAAIPRGTCLALFVQIAAGLVRLVS